MSVRATEIGAQFGTDSTSLESALTANGWHRRDATSLRLPTDGGDALLLEIGRSDSWRQFRLYGGAVPQSANERLLADNARLFGPMKFVAAAGARPICRLDVVDDLRSCDGGLDANSLALDRRAAWARVVTAVATGRTAEMNGDCQSDEAAADEIGRAGWPASLDDGQLRASVLARSAHRELTLERDPTGGVKLSVALSDLGELDAPCVEATLHLAQHANARLPLARFAICERDNGGTLVAEVGVGDRLIGGAWLLTSLCALETAVALCAREMDALRNPKCARLLLAARAAGDY